MRALLIRHGRTEANERSLYYGSTDVPLSPGGREELLALRAAGGYPEIRGMRAYTSGMRRAEETLSLLFGDLPHEAVPALREMDFGVFEMRHYEELRHDPQFQAWIEGDFEQNTPPGGESGQQASRRAVESFQTLCARGEDFLAVCHGGSIAAIMLWLFPHEGENRYHWMVGNGEGFLITLKGDKKTWTKVPAGGENHG